MIVRRAAARERTLRDGWASEREYRGPADGAKRFSLRTYRLSPGHGEGPYHLHTRSESAYFVIAGTIALRIAGDRHVLHVGDLGVVPPGIAHAVAIAGDEPAEFVELYAPAVADFVEVPEER